MRPGTAISNAAAAASIAVTISLSVSCTSHETTGPVPFATATLAEPPPTEASPTVATPAEQTALAEAVSTAVNNVVPGTEIGLAVYDRRARASVTSRHADQQFYTASVVKLLIVIQVLRDAGWEVPTGVERQNLVDMLAHSTDWVASMLWDEHGGPAIIHEVAALAGLMDTSPPRNPAQWEMSRMSPRDVLAVYEYIDNKMPREAGEFVRAALSDATDVAADGFDHFFGIPGALPNAEWAIKQGWMRINNGLVLNTTGIVGADGRYVVALLTQLPGGTRSEDGDAALTAGIAALAPTLD